MPPRADALPANNRAVVRVRGSFIGGSNAGAADRRVPYLRPGRFERRPVPAHKRIADTPAERKEGTRG